MHQMLDNIGSSWQNSSTNFHFFTSFQSCLRLRRMKMYSCSRAFGSRSVWRHDSLGFWRPRSAGRGTAGESRGHKAEQPTFKKRGITERETGRVKPHGCWLSPIIRPLVVSLFSNHVPPSASSEARGLCLPPDACQTVTDANFPFFLWEEAAPVICAQIFPHVSPSFQNSESICWEHGVSWLRSELNLPWKPCQNTSFHCFSSL